MRRGFGIVGATFPTTFLQPKGYDHSSPAKTPPLWRKSGSNAEHTLCINVREKEREREKEIEREIRNVPSILNEYVHMTYHDAADSWHTYFLLFSAYLPFALASDPILQSSSNENRICSSTICDPHRLFYGVLRCLGKEYLGLSYLNKCAVGWRRSIPQESPNIACNSSCTTSI